MGISFKISKTGRRLRPDPPPLQLPEAHENSNAEASDEVTIKSNVGVYKTQNLSSILSSIPSEEYEVSFTLNLFPDGFFIGKPSEAAKMQNLLQDSQRSLHPYNRAAETLFSAIESGFLPGDILDDIPSKYYNGTVVCEICDFRNYLGEQGSCVSPVNGVPVVKKVFLRMSLENIVKDISSIAEDSWTYGDLMEIESRILKALQPKLCLDPEPVLDRLFLQPCQNKVNLGMSSLKRRRVQPINDMSVPSNSQNHGKRVCIGTAQENAVNKSTQFGNVTSQLNVQIVNGNTNLQHIGSSAQNLKSKILTVESLPVSSQSPHQPSLNYQGGVQDSQSIGSPGITEVSSQVVSQNTMSTYADNTVSGITGKRDAQDLQHMDAAVNKKSKQAPVGQEGNQQLAGLHIDGTNGAETWRKAFLQHASSITGHRPIVNDMSNSEYVPFAPNQQLVKTSIKQEQADSGTKMETEKLKNTRQVVEGDFNQVVPQQLRHPPILQPAYSMRPQLTVQQWTNIGTPSEKEAKEGVHQRRKAAPSPRTVQSPMSKSGEFPGSPFYGSQREKGTAISAPVVGTPSAASSPSDSLQRIPQATNLKGKKGSSAKAYHTMSGVASPASVNNISAPSANSPSITVASMAASDSAMLERFSKIEMISQRYLQNNKKSKTENFSIKKQGNYSSQEIAYWIAKSLNAEDFTASSKLMSGSIFGGSINTCKTRIVKSVRTHVYQGSTTMQPYKTENRLRMTERPSDGSVTMLYDDSTDESDTPSNDCLFVLPNVQYADLLADQYVSLMSRDGYKIIEDQVQPIRKAFVQACGNPFITMSMLPDNVNSEGQHSEGISGQQSNNMANISANQPSVSQTISSNARMIPPGSNHGMQMPQGYLPGGQNLTAPARAKQLEQNILQQQQVQQQQMHPQQQLQPSQVQQQPQPSHQLQHSSSVLQINPLSQLLGQNSNLGGAQMVNRASQIQQLTALHQAQHQQQVQFSRKPVMGIGPAAMGLGNNMMGLSGLGNVMGIGGIRGVSSPVSPMAGLPSMGSNQMNLGSAANFNVGFRSGSIPANHAAALRMRMAQAQTRVGTQSPMTGLQGNTGQVLPNASIGMSMLNQTLNRPNVNSPQRAMMSAMGPPKIPGANIFMTQHQLQLQQLQQQHQLLQMQQQQQEQQQQIGSPLQQQQPQVSSPSVVGSPAMSMQQQMSTQPMSQQTVSPQQLSAGALQQMNNNNIGGPGPASPQLSSQTHGSIGSISSSPMEQLQGTNKSGSINTGQ